MYVPEMERLEVASGDRASPPQSEKHATLERFALRSGIPKGCRSMRSHRERLWS